MPLRTATANGSSTLPTSPTQTPSSEQPSRAAVKAALGKEPELFVEWAGGTDGAYYREAGIPTIGFGPAGEHMHGPNELVYVDTLIDQAKVYIALAYCLSK